MSEYVRNEGLDPAQVRIHAHAHNALLHIAATTGTVGVLLAIAIVLVSLRGAFSELGPSGSSGYAAGPGFALLGLLLVSAFDPVHLNAQTGALLGTLMAMSLVSRPSAAEPRS
jgi:O-antigen ligase